jgi:hypothetical protein
MVITDNLSIGGHGFSGRVFPGEVFEDPPVARVTHLFRFFRIL